MVEFRLLSALEAWSDGQLVRLGHARQQCVLAVLLIDANRPVSADQLIHRVWGDEGPEQSQNTLYSYISRLRRTLNPHDIHVARRSGGYVLDIDEATVDVHRFRHLLKRAKEAEDDHAAQVLLQEGLGLWHGEPLAGLSSPWLDTVREEWEAERWEAELGYVDVMLRIGHHSECLAALSARAGAFPLDERLAGQLMLALYRCGRPSDALDRYRQTRRHLSEELGTEPGAALRALHQQILDGDQALDLPDASVSRDRGTRPRQSAPVPHQLPAPPEQFIGRRRELAQLDLALAAHGATRGTVVLGGIGGIGKTWLALRWAHEHLERFPDGQLYLNLRGFEPHEEPLSPRAAIRSILGALGVARDSVPGEPEAQIGLYRSLVAGKQLLIVLDNARNAEQVRPLLPGSASCTVIVTSRNQMPELIAADGARPITPAALTRDEAHSLMAQRLGNRRTADEADAVDFIVTACAGLPLALAIVAARAATHPTFNLSMLANELRQSHGGLEAFTHGGTTLNLRSVFSWSCRALRPDAVALFQLLGAHPGPEISKPAARSLAGLSLHRTQTALAELVRAQLITEIRPGRYTLHDLLRAYVIELADEHTHHDHHAALLRAISHYTHTARHAAGLIEPYRTEITLTPAHPGSLPEPLGDAQEALAWLTTEHTVLLALIGHSMRAGLDTQTWQLTWTLSHFHAGHGHLDEWLFTQTAGLRAAERLGDLLGQALSHRALARVHTRLSRYADAESHATRALSLFRDLGDTTGQARTHLGLGWLLDQQNHHLAALEHIAQARTLFRSAGDIAGEARALNADAWSRTLLGDFQQAIDQCRQALSLLQDMQDRTGEAATWDTLGHAYHQFGKHDDAITSYQQAIELYRTLGDRYWEAQTLIRLANIHESTDDHHAALLARRQALIVLDAIGHPEADNLRTQLQLPTP